MKTTYLLQKMLNHEPVRLEQHERDNAYKYAVRIGSKVSMWFSDLSKAQKYFWNLG